VPSSVIFARDPARGWRPWGVLVPFLGVAFVVLATAPFAILLLHLHLLDDVSDDPVGLFGFAAFLVGPFGALILLVLGWTRFVERRPLATIGLATHGAPASFAGGLLAGVLLAGAVVAGIWRSGGLAVGDVAPAFASAQSLAGIVLLLACFAVQSSAEEILFRGWMLSALAIRFGSVAGVIVSSLVFALLHFSPHAPALFAANMVLFAAFAASWALRTGNIWGAMGWHSAWNWFLGTGFGLRITGLDTHMPALLVRLLPAGAVWLTGGRQGPEGSVICTAVLLAGIVFNLSTSDSKARAARAL